MLETFEDQVSRIEKQGFLEYAKTQKGFEEMIYFSKENNTVLLTPTLKYKCFASIVIAWKLSTKR